jgi:hypothetical protein
LSLAEEVALLAAVVQVDCCKEVLVFLTDRQLLLRLVAAEAEEQEARQGLLQTMEPTLFLEVLLQTEAGKDQEQEIPETHLVDLADLAADLVEIPLRFFLEGKEFLAKEMLVGQTVLLLLVIQGVVAAEPEQ